MDNIDNKKQIYCQISSMDAGLKDMIQRSGAIIIKEGKILLMHRRKNGEEYYAIPGGHIEDMETPEDTAIREVKEETGLDIELDYMLLESEKYPWHNYFYLAKNVQGEACLGGEELERQCEKNHYEIRWVKICDIPKTLLLPQDLKDKVVDLYCVKK